MTTRPLIRGQVAEVLNSHELVINRGSEHGVELGMRFVVLSPRGQDIEDPESGEVLGSVQRPKVEVQVFSLQDRLAVARTFRTSRVNVGGAGLAGLGMSRVFDPPKYVTRRESFKTEDAAWEEITEAESFVKVGDPVEEIFETHDEPDE